MRDAQKLAKALSETETSEADIFMASVLLKFRGSKQAQSFVKEIQNRIPELLKEVTSPSKGEVTTPHD